MFKHHFIQLIILLFFFLSCPFSAAMALSTGTGTFDVSAGITYDSNTLEFFSGRSSLETWTIARINAETLVDEQHDTQGVAIVPGWDIAPTDSAISYGDSSVTITNDHTDAMNPEGHASLAMSTAGSPATVIRPYSAIMYFANVKATGTGSFTFFVDYNAEMIGSTTSTNDYVNLAASAQASLYTMVYDDNGVLQWGNYGGAIDFEQDARWLQAIDGDSVSIDDFTGQLSLTVDYTDGDMFYLRFDGQSSIQGYSEDQDQPAPVPEPSTILLLGGGLLALGWYGRKRKKT